MIDVLKTIGIAIVGGLVVLLALTVLAPKEEGIGGVYNTIEENFAAGLTTAEFTQGGGCESLVDANGGTYTLTASQMDNQNCFIFTAGGAGQAVIALQLPTATELNKVLPNIGDFREWVYDASALAAATTTTVTAGTGIDLIAVTNADDVIDGAEYARLSCWRKSTSAVACITSELLNAD